MATIGKFLLYTGSGILLGTLLWVLLNGLRQLAILIDENDVAAATFVAVFVIVSIVGLMGRK